MKKIFISVSVLLVAMLVCVSSQAQTRKTKAEQREDKEFTAPDTPEDTQAEYIGGEDAMQIYLDDNAKYPSSELKAGHSGYVTVNAFVGVTGNVSGAKVGMTQLPETFNAEAIRVVSRMPNWKPATKAGKPIKSEIAIPIYFSPDMARRKALREEADKEAVPKSEPLPKIEEAPPSTAVKAVDEAPPSAKSYDPPILTSAKGISKDAVYIGGDAAMMQHIQNVLNYPSAEAEYGIEAKVVVEFMVNTKGEVQDARIMQSGGAPFDREALRVVGTLKKFTPAMMNDTLVNTYRTLPLTFGLGEDAPEKFVVDEFVPEARITPVDAHDEYAVIFADDNFNQQMLKICKSLPREKEAVYLGVMLTVKADGTYDSPKVVVNSANLEKAEIVSILKKLPKAKPAVDYGKPVASRIFIAFSNDEFALKALDDK
jgi:TonB family protein